MFWIPVTGQGGYHGPSSNASHTLGTYIVFSGFFPTDPIAGQLLTPVLDYYKTMGPCVKSRVKNETVCDVVADTIY